MDESSLQKPNANQVKGMHKGCGCHLQNLEDSMHMMMMAWKLIISYIIPYSVIIPHFQSQRQRRLHSNLKFRRSYVVEKQIAGLGCGYHLQNLEESMHMMMMMMMMAWESIISYILSCSVIIRPHFQSQLQQRLHSNLMWWRSSLQKFSARNPWLKVFPKCSAALWNSMLYDIYFSTGKLSLNPCNLGPLHTQGWRPMTIAI